MSNVTSIEQQYPYFNDYDPSKKFMRILAKPGSTEQAREFTQIQTMVMDYMSRISDTLMREGNIIKGMSYNLIGTKLTVDSGRIYLQHLIHDFDKQSVDIPLKGEVNVGVKLEITRVTSNEDASLKDPAIDSPNYGKDGAHRLKAEPKLVVNDSLAPTIYRFVDGVLQIDPIKPQLDVVSDMLARRTFDESGNYKVHGLELWTEELNDDNLSLVVEAGKAYVKGYEVVKPSAIRVTLPKSKEKRTILNEPKTFSNNGTKYYLNNSPVNKVTRLTGVVQTSDLITRGVSTAVIDYLPKSPVVEIISIDGYSQGVDFQLRDDGVDWSIGSKRPSPGGSYTVVYKYNKVFASGTEFALKTDDNGRIKRNYILFTGAITPVASSQFYIDYEFFLSRKDLVSINKDGEIIITRGQSDVERLISTPVNTDLNILHLGTVLLSANSSTAVANSFAVTSVSMENLTMALKRIEDLEYNQAVTALDREAMENESPTDLKGVLSEGFNNLSKGDLNHPDFTGAYELEEGRFTLRANSTKTSTLQYNNVTSSIGNWERLISTPYTEEKVIQQEFGSSTMLVNPYSVFNNMSVMKLNPSVDNWVDSQEIKVTEFETKTETVRRWWYTNGVPYYSREKYLFENMILDKGQAWTGYGEVTGTIISNSSKTILDEAIMYMRQIEVTLECSNLLPGSDNLELYFDNQKVPITAISPFPSGTNSGTLRATNTGVAKGKFTVPTGVRTGTREVVLRNANNIATASYTASGRKKVVQNTVLVTRVTAVSTDPLAQTFQFDVSRVVSSVGLYFAVKDPKKNVVVQIRNVVNGYPSNTIYAEKVVTPENINVSANSSAETVVRFDNPIVCDAGVQYAIVIETDSPIYSMYIGDLGGKDLIRNTTITKQPYVEGTLFSSSNSITWTAHQASDLKFNIYCARFQSKGVIEFNPLTNLSTDRMVLMTDFLTFQNTSLIWEAKLNGGQYQPIGNYEDRELSAITNTVQLRATLNANTYMSPLVAKDSLSLISFVTDTASSYISRNVDMPEPGFRTIKQVFEGNIPSGCTAVPKFSTTSGVWKQGSLQGTEVISDEYVRYTYSYTIPSHESAGRSFRARLDISTSNRTLKPRVRKFMNILK